MSFEICVKLTFDLILGKFSAIRGC